MLPFKMKVQIVSFVTGTACCGHFSPLRIWDLNSGQLMTHLGSDFPPGAGVLDVMYETPSTLLSCGYDTYVRYWDLRTSVRQTGTTCWPLVPPITYDCGTGAKGPAYT
ncbi:LOW QUALITY PROTEIN: hypothetical protein MC885_007226 [Smutsia gigantea]|nr:LOW QUALITY PROTEIN: hypothetical protein MC885_007226 [Smutsia gigantea]